MKNSTLTNIYKKLTSVFLIFTALFSYIVFVNIPSNIANAATVNNYIEVSKLTTEETDDTITEHIKIVSTDNSVSGTISNYSVGSLAIYLDVSIKGDSNGNIKGTVTCNNGKPSNTSITLSLQSRETKRSFSTIKSTSGINFLTYKSKSIYASTNNKTRIWKVSLSGKFLGNNFTYNTYSILFNRKAIKYPNYTEVYSKKKLWEPPTNLSVSQNNRAANFRKDYINDFKKKYPNSNINWRIYEIHHMRPLQYGGSNKISNGIALPSYQHKVLTNWWRYY